MIRSNPASSMQKTYDDCYLMCSTAVYFEQKNDEDEALKQWRTALDTIYYHNAYKVPAQYRPKTETEKALQDSLHDMEMQCKERVDLLDALRKSRLENADDDKLRKRKDRATGGSSTPRNSHSRQSPAENMLAGGTLHPANYADISRPTLPPRTAQASSPRPQSSRKPSDTLSVNNLAMHNSQPNASEASLDVPPKRNARTPSPEKRSGFRTTLRPARDGRASSKLAANTLRTRASKPAGSAAYAATLAWPGAAGPSNQGLSSSSLPTGRDSNEAARSLPPNGPSQAVSPLGYPVQQSSNNNVRPPSPSDYLPPTNDITSSASYPSIPQSSQARRSGKGPPPPVPPHRTSANKVSSTSNSGGLNPSISKTVPEFPSYRREYPEPTPLDPRKVNSIAATRNGVGTDLHIQPDSNPSQPIARRAAPTVTRKAVPGSPDPKPGKPATRNGDVGHSSGGEAEHSGNGRKQKKQEEELLLAELPAGDIESAASESAAWDARVAHLMQNLPRGCDEQAAKAIFNEVVIKGDEVRWEDVAGLDSAKNALKEAVVYPFLRPDLFMGLREPARGMLLFGPPGTGKTMLARAVATESHSTFFAISASSLTSKYLGESEKLVRALFLLAKALTPAIIFVDEIDSLLSTRSGSGEHEATRRIKTEFLIQWSDLAKAAAGRESKDNEGDATRVLVLAATNMPWAIDDAARRRFVRRQYIPLPEPHVREDQLRRLISAQNHNLSDHDIQDLVALTDGFSGSDITALAKDAAMGPLRSLGEQLLHMAPGDIRPIAYEDFEASLINIRPSVSKQGLKEFEDWAKEFGERAG